MPITWKHLISEEKRQRHSDQRRNGILWKLQLWVSHDGSVKPLQVRICHTRILPLCNLEGNVECPLLADCTRSASSRISEVLLFKVVMAGSVPKAEESLFISVITLGEIEKGILKLRATETLRGQKLTAWLGKLEQRFAGRILPLDTAALHVWAQIVASAEQAGMTLPVLDSLLMATAQCHGLTIVTRNVQDFAIYPQVFNPWGL